MTDEEYKSYWAIRFQCNECEHNWHCEIPQEKRVKPCEDYQMAHDLCDFLHSRNYGSHGGLSHKCFT